MEKAFRLHGDNIVECERIMDLIIKSIDAKSVKRRFLSLACMEVIIETKESHTLKFTLFPGFNKNTSDRWNKNILSLLKEKGSFLDETPDVIISELKNAEEEVIIAIEFCSALQAGNQAWQRSGRAYSTGRTKCPYIYIVDFVKYELDTNTRKRKNLRFPNASVPYSYISHSKNQANFVVQSYFRAEEFQPTFDKTIKGFDESIFTEKEVGIFIVNKLLGRDTTDIERVLLEKNLKMVQFLSKSADNKNFTIKEWSEVNKDNNILTYSSTTRRFRFRKKMAEKSISGKVKEFNTLVQSYSIGIASVDLPFGLIPGKSRTAFANSLIKLYGITDINLIKKLQVEKDLIVCMLKGFKPRGDDNRPDRGALPLIRMLVGEEPEVLTFIYGPMLKSNLKLFDENIVELSNRNGLWKSFVGLSDFIILDSPVIPVSKGIQSTRQIDNSMNKSSYLNSKAKELSKLVVSPVPNQYQENDVDTILHVLFKYIIRDTFEGMCNPPGGDWSGMSILNTNGTKEFRWLSLPRVSADGKRPDHVVELFNLANKPILLTVESKEKGTDLEHNVGIQLKKYIQYLMSFKASVEKDLKDSTWKISSITADYNDYYCVSMGAFIDKGNDDFDSLHNKCKCDIIFSISPKAGKWKLKIKSYNDNGKLIKDLVTESIKQSKEELNIFEIEG